MRPSVRLSFVLVAFLGLWAQGGAAAAKPPAPVSPGSAAGTTIAQPCPTFSWDALPGAVAHELAVFRVGAESGELAPVLRQEVAGAAGSWTPSESSCLERGGRYAWAVRARGPRGVTPWSPPSLFGVAAAASASEVLSFLQSYLDSGGSIEKLAALDSPGARQPCAVAGGTPVRRPMRSPGARTEADPVPVLKTLATHPGSYAAHFGYDDSAGSSHYVGLGFNDLALYVFGDSLFNAGTNRFLSSLIIPRADVGSSHPSGADTTPEAYQILAQTGCDAEHRGEIRILRPSVAGQDSLCFCGLVTEDYSWWCFNP